MVKKFENSSGLMKKIDKIVVGTHNNGKFKEICDFLPKNIIKISPKKFNLSRFNS